jgi:hypothetical protein
MFSGESSDEEVTPPGQPKQPKVVTVPTLPSAKGKKEQEEADAKAMERWQKEEERQALES